MKYERIEKAVFLERPNRFIAYALVAGRRETIHVKNTGRCAELLKAGAVIYVQESLKPERKTKWDLIAVEKGDRMVNMDSQIPSSWKRMAWRDFQMHRASGRLSMWKSYVRL